MGYVFAPKELMSEFRKIYQYIAFSASTPMQYAFMQMLENKEYYLQIGEMYQKKRDLFNEGIKGSKFKIIPSNGTYFQLLNYSKITDQNDFDFAVQLTTQNKIASIPISKFYRKNTDNKMLRFCFAKGNETLLKSIDILCKI
jgi:methionine aminotransferase